MVRFAPRRNGERSINLSTSVAFGADANDGWQHWPIGGALLRTNETATLETVRAHKVSAPPVAAQESLVALYPARVGSCGLGTTLLPSFNGLSQLPAAAE